MTPLSHHGRRPSDVATGPPYPSRVGAAGRGGQPRTSHGQRWGAMRNWAGNQSYRASAVHEPTSVEEIQELVRGSTRIRALGSRHSFNDIADTTGDHVSLAAIPRRL